MVVPFVLLDDPDNQQQRAGGWDLDAGNLLIYGGAGSGTTTALLSVAVALAHRLGPGQAYVYGIDYGRGELRRLEGLPQVGSIVGAGDDERTRRLLRWLSAEVSRRRSDDRHLPAVAGPPQRRRRPDGPVGRLPTADRPSRDAAGPPSPEFLGDEGPRRGEQNRLERLGQRARWPRIVVFIDGARALWSDLDSVGGPDLTDVLARVLVEGPEVGVHVAAAVDHGSALRHAITATVAQKLVLRLADPAEARQLGAPLPASPHPGRGHLTSAGLAAQVGDPGPLEACVDALRGRWEALGATATAPRIGVLPGRVDVAELRSAVAAGQPADGCWQLPIGLGAADLEPVRLSWYRGEHVLIAGPARSGRTAALAALGRLVQATVAGTELLGVSGAERGGGGLRLAGCRVVPRQDAAQLWPVARAALAAGRPVCVLVDDAEQLEGHDGDLHALMDLGARFAVAGRAETLRTSYGHWTKRARSARTGLLLQPDVDLDGELLGCRLPRRADVALTVGRGYLVVSGSVELVQAASVIEHAEHGT